MKKFYVEGLYFNRFENEWVSISWPFASREEAEEEIADIATGGMGLVVVEK